MQRRHVDMSWFSNVSDNLVSSMFEEKLRNSGQRRYIPPGHKVTGKFAPELFSYFVKGVDTVKVAGSIRTSKNGNRSSYRQPEDLNRLQVTCVLYCRPFRVNTPLRRRA
jgi:hypothetical protein